MPRPAQVVLGSPLARAVALCAAGLSAPASAAEITATRSPGEPYAVIRVEGPIEDGDDVRFAEAAGPHLGSLAMVSLASPGGSVPAALGMGSLIRSAGFATIVEEGAACRSACVLVWLAGVQRHLTGSSDLRPGEGLGAGPWGPSLGAYLDGLALPGPAIRAVLGGGDGTITPEAARGLGLDVWEFRDDRVVSPYEEPGAYTLALQAADLAGLAEDCAGLLGLEGEELARRGRERLAEGRERFGEVQEELAREAAGVVGSERAQSGVRAWCLVTEARLRFEGLPVGIDSPSFDCAAARRPAERAICASPDLWALDRVLAGLGEPSSGGASSGAGEGPAGWVEERDRCGADAECLARAYWRRITEIGL